MRDARLTEYAREMRRAPAEAEIRLWLALRAKRFTGIKFRRQKVIGPYIVDFACREPMLVIELDGDNHAAQVAYDAKRTKFLQSRGYDVIRFSNDDVVGNFEAVLDMIAQRIAPLPTLSPEGERAK